MKGWRDEGALRGKADEGAIVATAPFTPGPRKQARAAGARLADSGQCRWNHTGAPC
jgi:hypothetical protein